MPSKLRELMADKDVSAEEVARAIGVSEIYLEQILKGQRMPPEDVLTRMMDFFDCELEAIILK